MARSTTFQDSTFVFVSFDSTIRDAESYRKSKRIGDDRERAEIEKKSKSKSIQVEPKETTTKEKKLPCLSGYPKGSFFCLGNEFAERFSFYGMRAILTMYMFDIYGLKEHQAKFYYHAFVSLAYFTPLLGSILADGCLGRYRVILYLSIVYCFGHVLLVCSAVPQLGKGTLRILDMVGLFIIAFGTGGIKPCVSSFTSDQFPHTMTLQRKRFASFFYFSITFGSLMSEIVTPQISFIGCFGQKFCYPLAFGVPAIFVVIGLIIFVAGKKFYKIKIVKENVLCQVVKCVGYSIKRGRCKCRSGESWLDLAKDKFDPQLVEDVKSLFHIILLFIPAISFWALFDQQGSSWVLQANKMDGHFERFTIGPSQITMLNPLFVIILVPTFYLVIYPFLWSRNCLLCPLRRMGYGCVFAVLSFVVAGIVQLFVNKTLIVKPDYGKCRYVVVNFGDCDLVISQNASETVVTVGKYAIEDFKIPFRIETIHDLNCSQDRLNVSKFDATYNDTGKGHIVVVWESGLDFAHQLTFDLAKPIKGQSNVYILFHPKFKRLNASIVLTQKNYEEDPHRILNVNSNKSNIDVEPYVFGTTLYDIELRLCVHEKCANEKLMTGVHLQNGGIYCFVLGIGMDDEYKVSLITLTPPNSVSILWMIPQYFLISVAEILFALSGSEFSYGQAALTMKSTLQACWLMSVAFGNVVDMIISAAEFFDNAAVEYFVYAGLMSIFTIIFILISKRYKYVERDKIENERSKSSSEREQKITDKKQAEHKSGIDKERNVGKNGVNKEPDERKRGIDNKQNVGKSGINKERIVSQSGFDKERTVRKSDVHEKRTETKSKSSNTKSSSKQQTNASSNET